MKRISFLQVVVLAVLLVTVTSCGVPMGATGDYYEEAPVKRNGYYGAQVYGSPNTIIVERDPFTGQYYQVSPGPYGGVYGAPVYPYGGRRHYNNNRPYYRSNPGRSNGYYRGNPQPQRLQQTPSQRQHTEQKRQEAKEIILGKKRS
jgi:hypothetical protein